MAKRKLRVAVLFGGQSAEHEVSLVSAEAVIKGLDKKKYQVIPIGISKQGGWHIGDNTLRAFKNKSKINLQSTPITPDPNLNKFKIDVIFPVLHGTLGEDGTVQGLLELSGIPYVGAGVLGSSIGMDKIIQKMIFKSVNLPTPKFIYFTTQDKLPVMIRRVMSEIKLPCFVKPANLGSSVGISKVIDKKSLLAALKLAFKYDRRVIVEQAINKPLEIECAVLGNDNPVASVLGQIVSSNDFYDYDAKYVDGKSKAIIPAPLKKTISDKIRSIAIDAYKCLDLAGMSRVDFLVQSGGKVYLNEVNTIPGFTSISMYPKLWQASGLEFSALLDKLIVLALERKAVNSKLNKSFKPKKSWYK